MGPEGPQGAAGLDGAQGPTGYLQEGSSAGNTPYWNGTAWVTNNSTVFNNGGNVGINTAEPSANLQVAGTFVAGANENTATGLYSAAFGNNSHAQGNISMAWGYQNTVTNIMGTAWGQDNFIMGYNATAWGRGNDVSGEGATGWGANNVSSNNYSTAFGAGNFATGHVSTAIGDGVSASGPRTFAAGSQVMARSNSEIALGMWGSDYTPADVDGYNASDRLFSIGNGTGFGNRRNALTILKGGNIGLGTENPTATLDVAGTVKIADGSQGTGKVLTSDVDGNATWQNPMPGASADYSNPIFYDVFTDNPTPYLVADNERFTVYNLTDIDNNWGYTRVKLPANPTLGVVYTICFKSSNNNTWSDIEFVDSNDMQVGYSYVNGGWSSGAQFVAVMQGSNVVWLKFSSY